MLHILERRRRHVEQRAAEFQPATSGLELEPDATAGRYRVTYIYEEGPADKDWVRVKVGDYLLAINGKPVKVW